MKSGKSYGIVMFVAASLLAALGCLFLWHFTMDWKSGGNQHQLFVRQLCWHAIGIAIFAGAFALGWKRLLKAAPWLGVAWVCLWVVALMEPPVAGMNRWVFAGPFSLDVYALMWPVGALVVAWLYTRRLVKPWMVYVAAGCFGACFIAHIFLNQNRLARIVAYFNGADSMRSFIQMQTRTALDAARWIGDSGRSLRYLPDPHTNAVIAGASLVLGKWVAACAVALLAVIVACLSESRRRLSDPSRRAYLLAFGVPFAVAAVWNYLQNALPIPVRGCTFPLLSYGGSVALCVWWGLGVAVAAACDDEAVPAEDGRQWIRRIIGLSLAGVAISVLVWAHAPAHARFGEPMPPSSAFGIFGSNPVRGTILTAEGEPLAKSVGVYQVHIDPRAVRYERGLTSNDVVKAVSQGLGLTPEATWAIYANTKSRYIPVDSRIEGESLDWCLNERNRLRYGLVVERLQRRAYPLGTDASHVAGVCRYDGVSPQGISGLEYTYHDVLAGRAGAIFRGRPYAENLRTGVPTDGGSVRTTIRIPVQRKMVRILRDAVATNRAESAWAMAVRIPGGEIVAMDAFPAIDPNAPRGSFGGMRAFVNGAVQTLHEPGGLMKPLMYAMALEAGCVKPDEIRDFGNTTFTNLCQRMDTNTLWRGMARFGIGKKIGAGKLYGEEAGFVPPPERWPPITRCSFGIGQGLTMTGVQLVQAYATLANDGVRVTPHLVEVISDTSGNTIWKHASGAEERFVSAETAAAVKRLMLEQTNGVNRVAGVAVAGKASTFALVEGLGGYVSGHQYSETDFDTLYAGFFPAEKPEYAVIVGFRKPRPDHTAEKTVLPVFRELVSAIRAETAARE